MDIFSEPIDFRFKLNYHCGMEQDAIHAHALGINLDGTDQELWEASQRLAAAETALRRKPPMSEAELGAWRLRAEYLEEAYAQAERSRRALRVQAVLWFVIAASIAVAWWLS